jgi:hypothetical protein
VIVADKDRNKVIGLVIAIVLVFGFFIWRVVGTSVSEGKTVNVEHLGPSGQPVPAGAVANPAATPGQVVEVVPPANAGQAEPFRPVLPSANPGAVSSRNTGVPSGPIRPMQGNFGGASVLPNINGTAEAIPAAEEPRLTGIVGGETPLASFQMGGNGQSEIKGVGERLSNGMVVVSIHADSVTLRMNKSSKPTVLRIGS